MTRLGRSCSLQQSCDLHECGITREMLILQQIAFMYSWNISCGLFFYQVKEKFQEYFMNSACTCAPGFPHSYHCYGDQSILPIHANIKVVGDSMRNSVLSST